MVLDVKPVTLTGRWVRLEPLDVRHADELFEAGCDPAIWEFLLVPPPGDVRDMEAYIEQALCERRAGRALPFAILSSATGRAVGSTRYMDIRPAHRGLEVGWTWLSPAVQRTAVNTECKLLLLGHAFEALGCLRVQLKTDARNLRSQQAIERLGAVREGVLRRHMVTRGGFVRDTVMYSITDAEWPGVRERLKARLEREPG